MLRGRGLRESWSAKWIPVRGPRMVGRRGVEGVPRRTAEIGRLRRVLLGRAASNEAGLDQRRRLGGGRRSGCSQDSTAGGHDLYGSQRRREGWLQVWSGAATLGRLGPPRQGATTARVPRGTATEPPADTRERASAAVNGASPASANPKAVPCTAGPMGIAVKGLRTGSDEQHMQGRRTESLRCVLRSRSPRWNQPACSDERVRTSALP